MQDRGLNRQGFPFRTLDKTSNTSSEDHTDCGSPAKSPTTIRAILRLGQGRPHTPCPECNAVAMFLLIGRTEDPGCQGHSPSSGCTRFPGDRTFPPRSDFTAVLSQLLTADRIVLS